MVLPKAAASSLLPSHVLLFLLQYKEKSIYVFGGIISLGLCSEQTSSFTDTCHSKKAVQNWDCDALVGDGMLATNDINNTIIFGFASTVFINRLANSPLEIVYIFFFYMYFLRNVCVNEVKGRHTSVMCLH